MVAGFEGQAGSRKDPREACKSCNRQPRDVEPVGEGVMELRVDWGPGYRVYFARLGQVIVLLLCGGDKSTQQKDIRRAKAYFEDFKARSAKTKRGT